MRNEPVDIFLYFAVLYASMWVHLNLALCSLEQHFVEQCLHWARAGRLLLNRASSNKQRKEKREKFKLVANF